MDKLTLGGRVARARDAAGMTQESLASLVGIDRSAVTRLERGERQINVPELVRIADALRVPLMQFVSEDVPAVVSRRSDPNVAELSTERLNTALQSWAADVRDLLRRNQLPSASRPQPTRAPTDHSSAERLAQTSRRLLGLGDSPIADLGDASERLGLVVYSAPLGALGPDGACVEVTIEDRSIGAAVINGEKQGGRRRMTLAHELGHWVSGDAYDVEADHFSESMINSFAIHFLAPRGGVAAVWRDRSAESLRDKALSVAATFRLSWTAAVGQLRNLDIISYESYDALVRHEPSRGEFARLRLTWVDELGAPYISPRATAAWINAYIDHKSTAARTAELLRGTLAADDLPERRTLTEEDTRRSFSGHLIVPSNGE